jgi:hypothetical protein
MAKHIAPPATAEQIMQALGVTQEDREIIDRVLREVDEEEEVIPARPRLVTGKPRPAPQIGREEDDFSSPKKSQKS